MFPYRKWRVHFYQMKTYWIAVKYTHTHKWVHMHRAQLRKKRSQRKKSAHTHKYWYAFEIDDMFYFIESTLLQTTQMNGNEKGDKIILIKRPLSNSYALIRNTRGIEMKNKSKSKRSNNDCTCYVYAKNILCTKYWDTFWPMNHPVNL